MCGIAVTLGLHGRPADRATVERMTKILLHRGPDDGGIYLDGSVGFGFRRLAILDLSDAAHQPMVSDDGRYIMVFNGEIYNFLELRAELQTLGYRFRSSGDSEVLLAAYREWGPDCLPRLNGMWAFVIYDRQKKRLFGSRDRFGVKPLYIYRDKEIVLLASEIKAIRASGLYRTEINWTVAARFLLEGQLDTTTESFYQGIHSLPPGMAFEADTAGYWTQWHYWSLAQLPAVDIKDPTEAFAELFEDSVRLRMRSDVPVGVCLSGGLDSTSILCAAARHRADYKSICTEPLLAFCYMDKAFDESGFIADTLAQTGAEPRVLQETPSEVWNNLRRFLWFQDEPVHNIGIVVEFELMRLITRNRIRVVLNGQGADETIGGYFSYFTAYWQTLLRKRALKLVWGEIDTFTKVHGGNPHDLLRLALTQLLARACHHVPLYRWVSNARYYKKCANHPWYSPDLGKHLVTNNSVHTDNSLKHTLRQSVVSAPLPLYLRIEDRNSMAHSVEVRLPFLDYRLVSLVFSLPDEWKLRGAWNKVVLREAMRGSIPESVRIRPQKFGFSTSLRKWFAHDLCEPMLDLVSSQAFRERGIYNASVVIRDLEQHRTGQKDVAIGLSDVVQTELLLSLLKTDPTDPPVV